MSPKLDTSHPLEPINHEANEEKLTWKYRKQYL